MGLLFEKESPLPSSTCTTHTVGGGEARLLCEPMDELELRQGRELKESVAFALVLPMFAILNRVQHDELQR